MTLIIKLLHPFSRRPTVYLVFHFLMMYLQKSLLSFTGCSQLQLQLKFGFSYCLHGQCFHIPLRYPVHFTFHKLPFLCLNPSWSSLFSKVGLLSYLIYFIYIEMNHSCPLRSLSIPKTLTFLKMRF